MEESIRETFSFKQPDLRTYSPLTLAFIGDAVFDLVIRTVVVLEGNRRANDLNAKKVGYVNAAAQASLIKRIEPLLTDEERDIFKRGRNARSVTVAKNQSVSDYRKATGLEALCGYLYLKGETDRLIFLIKKGLDNYDEE